MKNHKNVFFISAVIISLVVISYTGCSSGLSNYESVFILRTEPDEFNKYYTWYADDLSNPADSIYFFVFSEKKEDLNIDTSKFEEIISNSVYKLNVFVVDSLLATDVNRKHLQGDFIIIYGEGVTWYKGFVKGLVHFSNDIRGKYVLKGKRRL